MKRWIYLITVHAREAVLRRLDAIAAKASVANDRQRARDQVLGHAAVTTKPNGHNH